MQALFNLLDHLVSIYTYNSATALLRQWPFDGTPMTVIPQQSLDGTTVVKFSVLLAFGS